jgi:translation elongation factor EF-1alpha
MKYTGMNVTKVKQQQGWYMGKTLSIAIMGVWAQSSE